MKKEWGDGSCRVRKHSRTRQASECEEMRGASARGGLLWGGENLVFLFQPIPHLSFLGEDSLEWGQGGEVSCADLR